MNVTRTESNRILGEASRSHVDLSDDFKESCLMGQRAIGALQLIRSMMTPRSLSRFGIFGIITNAIGGISEDEEAGTPLSARIYLETGVNVGPNKDVHSIDDIVRCAVGETPGQWWDARLRAKIDEDEDLVLDYIILETQRAKPEGEDPLRT